MIALLESTRERFHLAPCILARFGCPGRRVDGLIRVQLAPEPQWAAPLRLLPYQLVSGAITVGAALGGTHSVGFGGI